VYPYNKIKKLDLMIKSYDATSRNRIKFEKIKEELLVLKNKRADSFSSFP